MKNLTVIVPRSAADEAGTDAAGSMDMGQLDTLLSGLDDNGTPNTQENQEGNAPDNTQQNDNSQQSQAGDNTGSENANKPSAQDKQNFAFGQMRTQISQLTDMLGKVAKANGIEYTDNKDLMTKLNDDAINKMAQKQNVPVELLKEVEMLRQDSQAFKAQQLRDAAAIGFQNLKDSYGLTQEQLQQFAVELDQQGKNPFTQPVDLVREYKVTHFDEIVNAKVEKAVQEALAKSGAADQHSSTPASGQGGNGGSGDKITTVQGLSELLNDVK